MMPGDEYFKSILSDYELTDDERKEVLDVLRAFVNWPSEETEVALGCARAENIRLREQRDVLGKAMSQIGVAYDKKLSRDFRPNRWAAGVLKTVKFSLKETRVVLAALENND